MKNRAKSIRVLLVDRRPVQISGLGGLIDADRLNMQIVGHAKSHVAALELAHELQPDLILLRIFPDVMDARQLIWALSQRCSAKLLILKSWHESMTLDPVIEAGAHGVVTAADEASIATVREDGIVLKRLRSPARRLYDPPSQMPWYDEPDRARLASLTLREKELIRALTQDPSAKYLSIAERLGISEHTVHNHLGRIYRKLNLVNRIDLLIYALKHDLHEIDEPAPQLIAVGRTNGQAGRLVRL